MRCFGLHPDQVLARTPAGGFKGAASVSFAMLYGAASFGIVSVLAYSIWAYRLIANEGFMYVSIAAVYVGLTGLALSRLVLGAGAAPRFARLFAVAFAVYAAGWCAFWFGLRGRHEADLWGAAAGLLAMTGLLRGAFGKGGDFVSLFGVLFTCHALGYFLGEVLYGLVRGATGRLLWGASHGVGFGAGVGYVLQQCQAPLRAQLPSASASELTFTR